MKGGAVNEERSPENDAMDFRKALHDPLFCADTPPPSFSLEAMLRAWCLRRLFGLLRSIKMTWTYEVECVVWVTKKNLEVLSMRC